MNIDLALFYFFSSLALISAAMVISLTNAVHSVLFLIIVFCNMAGLLVLSGAEFLAFLLLIVYVGAIAVLFLFVVMMLNVKSSSQKVNIWSLIPISMFILISFLLQIISVISLNFDISSALAQIHVNWNNWILENRGSNNVEVIGGVLYTEYSFIFLTSGYILLIAMVGVIVLTMHQKVFVKKQSIGYQLSRGPDGVIKFLDLRK